MKGLFSDNKVNTGRQIELDIAKGFSIIFMIFLHCLMVVGAFSADITQTYNILFANLLGKPCAAPVFMFCMGVGIIYSRRSQPENMIKRGVKLFLLGILVNVGEFFIPHYLAGYLLNLWDPFPIAGGLLLFCVDILAFAGLAFVVMGVFMKLDLSNRQLLTVGFVLSLIGTFLRFTDFGNDYLNLFFGYFIGTAGGFTAFPLFNWLIFPIAGYVYGYYFIRAKDKAGFFRLWPIFIIVALAYFIFSMNIPNGFLTGDNHLYYFMTTLDVLFCLIYVHGNIGLCLWMSKILPDGVNRIFTVLSSNINNIYIIQWFIIPVTFILIVYANRSIVFNDWMMILISLVMLTISTLLALGYKKARL